MFKKLNKYSDYELLRKCLKHQAAAQKELYKRFSYTMFGICLRYAENRDEAEDILQESFIKVFQNLEKFEPTGPLGGWIRRIVINTALETFRKKKKQVHLNLELVSQTYFETTDGIIEQLNLDDLVLKIQQLPDGYRTIFNLSVIDGLKHQEIADLLGISEGTSKSQLSKAKAMLRHLIEEELTSEERRMANGK